MHNRELLRSLVSRGQYRFAVERLMVVVRLFIHLFTLIDKAFIVCSYRYHFCLAEVARSLEGEDINVVYIVSKLLSRFRALEMYLDSQSEDLQAHFAITFLTEGNAGYLDHCTF